MIQERNMKKVTIYTDGSSKGNPGPGGYGTIIQYVDDKGVAHEKELSCGYLNTTNNRMEVMAAIVGLESLMEPCEVLIVSDSKYLVDTFQKKWIDSWVKNDWKNWKGQLVKNIDLWKRIISAMSEHRVTFEWVKGHNEHPENERCDKLATSAADNPKYEDKKS